MEGRDLIVSLSSQSRHGEACHPSHAHFFAVSNTAFVQPTEIESVFHVFRLKSHAIRINCSNSRHGLTVKASFPPRPPF